MIRSDLDEKLIRHAFSLGVSDAVMMPVDRIPIAAKFAGFCKEPGCSGYGRSMSCPPHVMGPEKFKIYCRQFDQILVFKFDIPWAVLLSDDRYDVNRVIHETAAGLETYALENGYEAAGGFAGGCCKELFCADHLQCRALYGDGTCRHPGQARPSMSGMGVDFKVLSARAGWDISESVPGPAKKNATGLMAGSVLLKKF